ncbi:fungal hydrophobin-domain-containing protein [Boletus coccyginus]|nr:fungal hydrophobin-domain-containing protein [Boletus coccyginus]
MFIRFFIILFSVVAFVGVANAAPTELELEVRQVSQCNTGEVHCCDSTYSSASTFVTGLFGLLGLPPPTINVDGTQVVGISCSPTTEGGTGSGSSCTQQPVCCTGNTFNGIINIGCAPITINL